MQMEPVKSPDGLVIGALKSQYFAGEGTEEAPYLIHSAKDLAMLSQMIEEQYEEYGGCYYQLSGNIVLKRPGGKQNASVKSNHTPIGSEDHPFYGTFDGNGYVIKNLCINEPEKDNQGLFGVISENGIVCSVGVTGGVVCGRNNTGALAGTNRGTIEACFQSGEVYGQEDGTGELQGVIREKSRTAIIPAT